MSPDVATISGSSQIKTCESPVFRLGQKMEKLNVLSGTMVGNSYVYFLSQEAWTKTGRKQDPLVRRYHELMRRYHGYLLWSRSGLFWHIFRDEVPIWDLAGYCKGAACACALRSWTKPVPGLG